MLVSARRFKQLAVSALATAAVGFPAPAVAAVTGPSVVRVDAATGATTVLADGAPWSRLSGIAVGPTGTVYVANFAGAGSGIYSLTAPNFAITPLATASPTKYPRGLLLSGTTLYSLDAGVLGIDTSAPFTQRVVSPSVTPCDPVCNNPDPDSGTVAGTTLYGTSFVECPTSEDSVGEGGNWVVAVDLATGSRTTPEEFGCDHALGAIAAAPDGTLLIVDWGVGKRPTQIVRLNLANHSMTTVATGGQLKSPQGLALAPSGDLIVADGVSGILRIATSTGAQSTIATGPAVAGASNVAVDAGGSIYATVPGPTPVLKVAAKSRQRASTKSVRFTASCSPRCTLLATLKFSGITYRSNDQYELGSVATKHALKLKLVAFIRKQIASSLRKHRTVKATLTLTPQSTTGGFDGKSVSFTVRLT